MKFPTPKTIVVTPTPTPTPTSIVPANKVLDEALGDLGAQPAPTTHTPEVGVNPGSASHYQVNRDEITDTNLTLPDGVKFYGHLYAVKVVLPVSVTSTRLYLDGAYREVANNTKLVCKVEDAIALLRTNLVQELPDAQIGLTVQ